MEEISIPEAAELAHAAGAKLGVDTTLFNPDHHQPAPGYAYSAHHSPIFARHQDALGGIN